MSTTLPLAPNRIDAAAAHVQAMRPPCRALLAREALIAAAGGTLAFGPAEARLRRILAWTGAAGLPLISLGLLAQRLFHALPGAAEAPENVFVGIATLRETELRADIQAREGIVPAFVDQRSYVGFAVLPRPRLGVVLRHWRHLISEARGILSAPDSAFTRMDLMATLAMRVHDLAWLLSIFEALLAARPNARVFCSTADLPAHAAAMAGLRPEYHQHGLLGLGLVYPDFAKMVALTTVEGRHVQNRVPGIVLRVNAGRSDPLPVLRTLAIAGDYLATDPTPVTSLVKAARAAGYRVVIRPHPNGKDSPWSGIQEIADVIFDTEGRFEEFLGTWRPAIVATWFSTTLLDGLVAGALPVTFSIERGHALVYPLERAALPWPQAAGQLRQALRDESIRADICQGFRKVVFST